MPGLYPEDNIFSYSYSLNIFSVCLSLLNCSGCVSPVVDLPLFIPACSEPICVSSWCSHRTTLPPEQLGAPLYHFSQDAFQMFNPPTVVGQCPWVWKKARLKVVYTTASIYAVYLSLSLSVWFFWGVEGMFFKCHDHFQPPVISNIFPTLWLWHMSTLKTKESGVFPVV